MQFRVPGAGSHETPGRARRFDALRLPDDGEPEVNNFRTRTLALPGALCLLLAAGCGPEVPTVNFSVILPMTGPAGIYGEEIANGIQLRHEQLMSGDENSPTTS